MKFIRNNWMFFLVSFVILYLFKHWFEKSILTAPDFPYVYPVQLRDFLSGPFAWSSRFDMGFGGNTLNTLNLDMYLRLGIRFLVFVFHIPWNIANRILFFWPFLVIGMFGSYFLSKSILKNKTFASLSSLIYMSNTYVIMLAGGGQVGLMMAYAVAPVVVLGFINQNAIVFTIASTILVLFDLRFSVLIFGMIVLYGIVVIPWRSWAAHLKFVFLSVLIALGIHSFWIIPAVFSHSFALPAGYDNPNWVSYLSWAEFSRTISLLHPNWPENIFGKTYFMKIEFLIIPMLAFGSLLFISKVKSSILKNQILFFVGLSLVSAFLAKGVKFPFGEMYTWLFIHIPLFSGFRDPTKFYLLIVLSYSIIIPFTLQSLSAYMVKWRKVRPQKSIVWIIGLFLTYWLLTLSPLLGGQVQGTFKTLSIPQEYEKFQMLAFGQKEFSRTLVVPWRNRFVYNSEDHPAIDARDLFGVTDIDKIVDSIASPGTEHILKGLAVRYVVVPKDFTNEIFLHDRSYDDSLRVSVIKILDSRSFLVKRKEFVDMDVYEFTRTTGHFYTPLNNLDLFVHRDEKINPALYKLNIKSHASPITIVFSEKYDPQWVLWDGEKEIPSTVFKYNLNSFVINSNLTRQVFVYNKTQRFVDVGWKVSVVFLLLILLIFYLRRSKAFGKIRYIPLVIVASVALVGWVFCRLSTPRNIVGNTSVWWSPEWMVIKNPIDTNTMRVSRFGGGEVLFDIEKTTSLRIKASSSNDEKDAQGIDVFVDSVSYRLATPLNEKDLNISFDVVDIAKKHRVRIRHFCASSFDPCDVSIRELIVDNGAIVSQPSLIPTKTLAILGDSITTSFGTNNYSYGLSEKLGHQLHNASIFGSSVSEVANWDSALLRYQNDIVAFKPTVAIIFVGTNDLGQGIPLDVFYKNYSMLIEGIRKGSPTTKVITMGLLWRQDYASNKIQAFSRVIADVAKEQGISYIDPYDWLSVSDFQDVVHPSEEAQTKLTQKFYENLFPMIQ